MRALIVGLTTALWAASAAAAPVAARSPICVPPVLNTSAVKAASVTVSPLSGSRDATPRTQISFLGVPAGAISHVSVTGSRTGPHAGRLLAYSQGDGASFVPAQPFAEGERVLVRARVRAAGATGAISDAFAIAEQDTLTTTPETIHPGPPSEVQGFRSRTDLRPPAVTVTASSPAVAAGYEFAAPYTGPGQAGPMILDQSGALVWFRPLPTNTFATDFRVQEYLGQPVLTWWQGDISVHGFGIGEGVIADASYTDIARVRGANGLQADLHELQLTPQATALITAYEPVACDLSSVGGSSDAAVTDGVLQEIDVRTGLVMFQWTSLDHVALDESYTNPRGASTSTPFDFFHINSINLDPDGTLLVSARNTWAVYELDPRTGKIVWRLGGKRSSFAMGPGTGTAWQHDPRVLPGGAISIFDNGASPGIHRQSRAIVVALDAQHRRATLLSQIVHPPPLLSESQGNAQALENGDWLIGWGQDPHLSEFSASGALLFDARFPAHTQSYRSFRFRWSGDPAEPPAFAFEPGADGAGTVYASWNGATLVASWRVLSGPSPGALTPVAQAPRSGFETSLALPPRAAGRYLTVQALDASGRVIGTAPVAKG
ncbi:MAG TPA: arylsulfotransferase family protein [Solirubrobacteraceae bacterium]